MALHPQTHPGQHAFPFWRDLAIALVIGVVILLGGVVLVNMVDQGGSTTTEPATKAIVMSEYRAGEIGVAADTRDLGLYLQRQGEIGAAER
jgi:hypothetical protein